MPAIPRARHLIPAVLALWLTLLIAGCSTPKIDWGARLGDYTFDQAVVDLGPPDKQATLSDGTRVADWMTRRGGTTHVPAWPHYTHGLSCYGPVYPTYLSRNTPDYFLRLVFGPAGELQQWKKLAR